MVGEGAADADGKGNINAGDGGVAFLLASAGALPAACDAVRWRLCSACGLQAGDTRNKAVEPVALTVLANR